MTEEIYVYLVDFPRGIKEAVTPCFGGYTVYIDEKLDKPSQIKALNHALAHIRNGDFEKNESADQIEAHAHNN